MAKQTIHATVGGRLYIPRGEVPRDLYATLMSHLTWENPEYKDRVFRQLSTRVYDKRTRTWSELPRYIYGIETFREDIYAIAREFVPEFEKLCDERDITIEWDDQRVFHNPNPLPHGIELWDPQKPAVDDMLHDDYGHQGVLEAPCGSGKTVMLLYVVAELGQPTLILAHTDDLLKQWQDYIRRLLDYTPGLIQGDTYDIKQITLASVMTLARRELDEEFLNKWGCVILDEAHHCPAACFQEVMTQFPAYYRFGATATPEREDNLQGLLYAICGPVIAKVERRALKQAGLIVDPTVIVHETGFTYPYTNMRQWHGLVRALVSDRRRNAQIIDHIIEDYESGRHVQLVLSQQIDHLVTLSKLLRQRAPAISQAFLIAGGTKKDRAGNIVRTISVSKKERTETIKAARQGRVSVLFGTKRRRGSLLSYIATHLVMIWQSKISQVAGWTNTTYPSRKDRCYCP